MQLQSPYVKKFGTQQVIVDPSEKAIYTTLKEPFFSAGKQYGWSGNTVGLGIAKEIVNFAVANDYEINVRVGDKPEQFSIKAKDWLELVRKYKSIWKTKEGKEIYIVQWSSLNKEELSK